MARFFLSLFRGALIGVNLFLLNFQPSTEVEVNMFFAARMVFFLMLVIDYIQVAYFNNGIERIIGVIGTIIAFIFAFIDLCGFLQILVLEVGGNGYIIKGNEFNFIASIIKPFNAQTYVFSSWICVVSILGFEVINSGRRASSSRSTGVKAKETVSSKTA